MAARVVSPRPCGLLAAADGISVAMGVTEAGCLEGALGAMARRGGRDRG